MDGFARHRTADELLDQFRRECPEAIPAMYSFGRAYVFCQNGSYALNTRLQGYWYRDLKI